SRSMTYGTNTAVGWKGPPMNRPNTLAEVARRVSAGADFDPTLSEFLDQFYMNPERRASMIADEPPRLTDTRNHAILGAVAEHLARRWNLPAVPVIGQTTPRVFCTSRISRRRLKSSKPMLLAQSPLAFCRRMIFTEAEPCAAPGCHARPTRDARRPDRASWA